MKHSLILLSIVLLGACNTQPEAQYFGDKIDPEGAQPVNGILASLGENASLDTKIIGEVTEVCQKKGCWMKMTIDDGSKMQVRFKDYGFFVPKDIAGSIVILEGTAYWDTMSVEELRHYAEDAGKTPDEISQITEPDLSLAFEAKGVIVQ